MMTANVPNEQAGAIRSVGDFERELRALKKSVSLMARVFWGLFLAAVVLTLLLGNWSSLAGVGDVFKEPAPYFCQFFGVALYAIHKVVERKRYDRLQRSVEAYYESLRRSGIDEDGIGAERKAIGQAFFAISRG